MFLIDRATFDDLIVDDAEREIHGRCGLTDGQCPCQDSSFNRWHSGYLTDEEKKALNQYELQTTRFSGHPRFRGSSD